MYQNFIIVYDNNRTASDTDSHRSHAPWSFIGPAALHHVRMTTVVSQAHITQQAAARVFVRVSPDTERRNHRSCGEVKFVSASAHSLRRDS